MKKIPKKSVAFRLSFRFMIIVAAIVILLSSLFVWLLRLSIWNRQADELFHSAQTLCSEITGDYEPVSEAMGLPYFISYVIYDSESKITLFTNDPLLPKLNLTNGHGKRYFKKNYFADGDLSIMYCAVTCDFYGRKLIVQTSMDVERDFSSAMVNAIPKMAAIVFLPILLISFLISFLITKQTLRPVEKITSAAQKMSSTNLQTLLPVSNHNDELDALANTFNSLFESLRKDFDRERNFTSDVSHELKTPVAGILGQANLLKRWGKNDPKQLEESLEAIITEANSMNSIISNLLEISKLENGVIKPKKAELNLWALYSRLKNEFNVINPNVNISFDENIDVTIETDIELLHQVLTAMISNSVKFGAKNITLYGKKDDGRILLQEEDDGPGFSEEILPHIFERFYRGDASHNRAAGGAGLGLSISSTIIKVLGGEIKAENSTKTKGALLSIIL